MLTARRQLDQVESLFAEFRRDESVMRPLALYQAQHLAIVAMLRSVGHVLQKVDADTDAKRQWLKAQWPQWRQEPIFAEFIEFERNRLLKEFEGGIAANNPAITATGAVADAVSPSGAMLVVGLDLDRLEAADGTSMIARLDEGIAFWRRHLGEAETAFDRLG